MNENLPDPAEQNVERLLSEAYQPEEIPGDFAARTLARLEGIAAERRRKLSPVPPTPWKRIAWLYAANVVAILMLIFLPTLFWYYFLQPQELDKKTAPRPTTPPEHVAPRPKPAAPTLKMLQPGQEWSTAAQKVQLRLSDSSVVALNQNTRIKFDADRSLRVLTGEVFVETSSALVVRTPQREVTTNAGKLLVNARPQGTSVAVTQGKAHVAGVELCAGQCLADDALLASPAPRASHALEWARDLVAAERLTPISSHQGGALVARGPDGQEQSLSLRRYHVDVHIEDGFARTTIDQTYFNHLQGRLEGTFHFPLPGDASLSRLAMYVEGTRMEGGMVEREHGRRVYETIVHGQKDPALLEWVDGTTFKMRVFPLEGRQEKRILISYTQRLPSQSGKCVYRFPAGHSLGEVAAWSLAVRVVATSGPLVSYGQPTSGPLVATTIGRDLVLTASAANVKLERDLVLEVPHRPAPRFAEGEQDDSRYFMVRHRPEFSGPMKRARRDWVVLFESAAERDPLLARTQIEIVRTLLANVEHDDTFAILRVNNRAAWVNAQTQAATPANVAAAVAALEHTHLIGGLDLSRGLEEAAKRFAELKQPWLVHVGSGLPRLGVRDTEKLLKLLPQNVPYVGVGVGKSWNRSFMKSAADRSGGLFAHINPDENVGWRAFDLLATLNTPRLLDARIAAPGLEFRSDAANIGQGEELFAVTRLADGQQRPDSVTISGLLDGAPFQRTLRVDKVKNGAGYLPRTWGRLEIDRLAENGKHNRARIVELSKQLHVMSPFTSLLVLENDAMYEQYKVDRGHKDHWANYDSPATIPVYAEPINGPKQLVKNATGRLVTPDRPNAESVRRTILVQPSPWDPDQPLRRQPSVWLSDVGRLGRVQFRSDPLLWHRLILTNPDEGIDPELLLRFDLNRIEDVTVSGPVDPNVAVGIAGAPEGPPVNIPPPPGSGGGLSDEILRGFRSLRVQKERQMLDKAGQHFNFLEVWPVPLSETAEGRHRPRRREMKNEVVLSTQYVRPRLRVGRSLFTDLLQYAPGMTTTPADVNAVLEAEAALANPVVAGRIADQARALINKARATGWRSANLPGRDGQEPFTIICDGQGRFRLERHVALGLREIIVNDGTTLWHLYPEIGLGARRTPSRFHLGELATLAPWALPAVEELAKGADLDAVGERTVAVTPHQGRHALHLVFDKDGSLVVRKLIDKVNGKEVRSLLIETARQVADVPDLKPDLRELVVLPMPWRTVAHVQQTTALRNDPLALLAAHVAERHSDTPRLIEERFLKHGDRRLGFFTLMALSTPTFAPQQFAAQNLPGPLGKFMRRAGERLGVNAETKRDMRDLQPATDFVSRLVLLEELYQLVTGNELISSTYLARCCRVARDSGSALIIWTFIDLCADRLPRETHQERKEFHRTVIKELSAGLRTVPELEYAARYETARANWLSGRPERAAEQFEDLFRESLTAGHFPPIDAAFRQALLKAGHWQRVVNDGVGYLLARGNGLAGIGLADKVLGLGDDDLGERLVERLTSGTEAKVTVAAIALLCEHRRLDKAQALLDRLTQRPELVKEPELWKLAARLAVLRSKHPLAMSHLERALDLDWHQGSTACDVEEVATDYRLLLTHYRQLAQAATLLQQPIPPDLLPKVVRTIERWRMLAPRDEVSRLAAEVLLDFGQRELVWDYLTTACATATVTGHDWQQAAIPFRQRGEFELTLRCLTEAGIVDPKNAHIFLDQVYVLREMGKHAEGRALLQRLARDKWPSQYQPIQDEARTILGEP